MNELNILIYCLIIACLLPYVAKVPLAYAMKKQGGGKLSGYDNKQPRLQQKQLTGFGARCLAAHENSFEALILFAPAVLLVIATSNINSYSTLLAISFICFRTIYLLCYWFNKDLLRSSFWALAIISNIALIVHCIN